VKGNIHTNTVEGFFAMLKRGIIGSFHHVSKAHLHRYVEEFAFRYSNRIALGVNDGERAARIILGAERKRLTYQTSTGNRAALTARFSGRAAVGIAALALANGNSGSTSRLNAGGVE
jgi:hypothetical protein